jgi:rusticyanin
MSAKRMSRKRMSRKRMSRKRTVEIVGVAVVVGVGLCVTLAVAFDSGSHSPGMMGSGGSGGSMSSYYQSMMKRYDGGSMMGGSTGSTSYSWMMGGANAPGWMSGGALPASMMGTNTNAGEVMGQLFANAPGPRVKLTEATRLGNQVPPGATVDRSNDQISFSSSVDDLVVLANPSGGAHETFRIAGLVNPRITVKSGARVSIELVNADADSADGFVVTTNGSASSPMPMTSAAPAFNGSALWFLGNSTTAGMHTGTFAFTANKEGTYQYLCPVPGQSRDGMNGTFVVSS